MNTISIRCINNKVFQEIKYTIIDELNENLINIINNSNDIYVQLILNLRYVFFQILARIAM